MNSDFLFLPHTPRLQNAHSKCVSVWVGGSGPPQPVGGGHLLSRLRYTHPHTHTHTHTHCICSCISVSLYLSVRLRMSGLKSEDCCVVRPQTPQRGRRPTTAESSAHPKQGANPTPALGFALAPTPTAQQPARQWRFVLAHARRAPCATNAQAW